MRARPYWGYSECDDIHCNAKLYYADYEDEIRKRFNAVAIGWWFDYAGAFCPKHATWHEAPISNKLTGLTDDALAKILDGVFVAA